jgi:hypothetical protein
VSGIGSNLSLTPTYEAPIKLNEIQGNTLQDGTPTPDTPVEIQSVTGLQKVNITGKNLFNFNTFISSSNMVVIDSSSSNSLVARVTQASTWATVRYRIFNLKENTNYSLKYDFENSYNSELYKHTWVVVRNPITGDNIYNDSYYKNDVVTFNTGDNKYLDLIFQVTINAPAVINTLTITNIQLEQGSTATSYEPYKGNTYEVNLGKNLLDTSNAESRTHNGITFTLDNDGSITANGTATSLAFMLVLSQAQSPLYKAGNYAFSLVNEMPNNCYARFEFFDSNNTMILRKNITKQDTATLSQDCYLKVSYVITSGTVLNNFVNYIQLEKGSIATSYSPYFTPIELNKINTYQDSIKKSTGKNILNSEIEAGEYNINTGEKRGGAGAYRTATPVEIEPNTTYKFSINGSNYAINVLEYDKDMNFIGYLTSAVIPKDNSFKTSSNTKYINIFRGTTGGNENWQIEPGDTATSYEPYGKVWYIEKQIGKVVLDGSETNWNIGGTNTYYLNNSINAIYNPDLSNVIAVSNYFKWGNGTTTAFVYGSMWFNNNGTNIRLQKDEVANVDNFKTWLSTHNTEIKYIQATPTYIEITNTELIEDLETLYTAKSQNGTTNISITSEDLEMILNVSALKSE